MARDSGEKKMACRLQCLLPHRTNLDKGGMLVDLLIPSHRPVHCYLLCATEVKQIRELR